MTLFSSCEKSELERKDSLSQEANLILERYSKLLKQRNVSDSFLFFTDPHLLGSDDEFSQETKINLDSSFDLAKELYDILKPNFCLCGGDWLNQRDSQEKAKEKLLYADKLMKSKFRPYYKMMGNHDTNYQGIVSSHDSSRGDLPRTFVDNHYFSESGSAFYSFKSGMSEFFILDSGIDWSLEMDDYRNEQIKWLSLQLLNSKSLHKIIGLHMVFVSTPDVTKITPMAKEVVSICNSFNTHKIYKGKEFEVDFTNSEGLVHFILTGHCHMDFVENVSGIPIIGTRTFYDRTHPFDICTLDFNSGFLDMIRVGEGVDRRVQILI